MYRLQTERTFSAAHAIVIGGSRESLHGHDWRVRLVVTGPTLDADGLLCDFHLLQRVLEQVIAPFKDGNLNDIAPFDALNPTAEHVAMHIATTVRPSLPSGLVSCEVSVTEAAGCEATYAVELMS
ncbi:MAG: 6-carboxytetrahydropterin synthase [Phycisphaerae bacterium]|nr:6-carboxytetrahydropterin synthase [Phycisphaerae bacterium]